MNPIVDVMLLAFLGVVIAPAAVVLTLLWQSRHNPPRGYDEAEHSWE